MSLYESFKKYQVKADSIEDFHNKYHKASRFTDRGQDYVDCVIKSSYEEFNKDGFTFITHHDSKTGETVSWYGKR
jgi:folate-dependent tRNA-U54 methylase TrmFO/GidA